MKALEIFLWVVIIAGMWAILKDGLYDFAQTYPVISTILVGLVAALAWRLFIVSPALKSASSKNHLPPPVVSQSAAASGGSTINQAGGSQTIIINNYGVSRETVREQIREIITPASALSDLSARYPAGFVIFGISNGHIVREVKGVEVEGDWDGFKVELDTATNKMAFDIPYLNVSIKGHPYRKLVRVEERGAFLEKQPVPSWAVPGMYYEVLDMEKKIFLIGFK